MTIACAVALLFIGFSETLTFEVVDVGLDREAAFIGVLLAVQGIGAMPARSSPPASSGAPASVGAGLGLIVFWLGTTLLTSGTLPSCSPA